MFLPWESFNMTIQENPGINPLYIKKENLERKKREYLEVERREGEWGREEATGKGEAQTWPSVFSLVPTGRSSGGSNQILTGNPYVESSGLKHSFCFYLLFLWGIHFGSNFPILLRRSRDFKQSRNGMHSPVLATCQILLQFFVNLAYYGMEIWSLRHVKGRRLFWFLPFLSLIHSTIIEQLFYRRSCPKNWVFRNV